jgi:hypothetical protein
MWLIVSEGKFCCERAGEWCVLFTLAQVGSEAKVLSFRRLARIIQAASTSHIHHPAALSLIISSSKQLHSGVMNTKIAAGGLATLPSDLFTTAIITARCEFPFLSPIKMHKEKFPWRLFTILMKTVFNS